MNSNSQSFFEKIKLFLNKYPYLIIFLIFLALSSFVKLDPLSDDLFFKSASANYSIFEFLSLRYFSWSTRFISEGLLYLLSNMPIIVWRLLNSAAWTLLVYSIVKTLPKKEADSPSSSYLILLLILCINISVIASSGFQLTGSLNYILAISLGVYISIYEIKNLGVAKIEKKDKDFKFLGLPILFFINEQVGITVLLLFIFFYGYRFLKYREFHSKEIFIILASIITFIFIYFAPGSKARFNIEVSNWYPNFLTISMLAKIKIFSIWLFTTVFIKMSPLILILGIFLSYLLLKQNKKNIFNLFASTILLLPVALSLINNGLPNSQYSQLDKLLYSFDYSAVYSNFKPYLNVYSGSRMLYSASSYFFWSIYSLTFIAIIIKFTKLKGVFIIFTTFASLMIFYFTPTLFGSGNRILLLPSVLLVLLLVPLINKAPSIYKVLIFCIAVLTLLFLISFWSFNGFLSIY